MIDAIVITTVIALIAAAALPTLLANNETSRITNTAATLQLLQYAIDSAGTKGFVPIVGNTPSALSQLSSPITTAMTNSCGSNYRTNGANQVGKWNGAGPFFNTPIVSGVGLPLPIGTVNDAITHLSGTTTATVTVPNVTIEDATNLDAVMEAAAGLGSTAGVIQWTTPAAADGTVTLTYVITTVSGC